MTIEQLSDFEPKGAVCRAFGVYHPGGFPQRAGRHRARWDGDLVPPGREPRRPARREPDLRRPRGRRQPRALVTDLGSAPLPPVGDDDHVRGPADGPLLIEYASFECHFCRVAHLRIDPLALRRVFRHFPVKSKHPRAWPAACAAEAAALQGRFWEIHDSLYADQGRLEDPHLWARAEALRARPRPLRGRPPLGRGHRPRQARLRRRRARRGGGDAHALPTRRDEPRRRGGPRTDVKAVGPSVS